ncbi:leishmanolysin family protein (macronuclear) [Tetrahymena thermophila SB210]|uniref:Leishmanolysin family protein n=1 Tax=Tetrahymena thermophila (strain SB210) TaxID=312017 RepID=Q22LJ0_TETTS|nr:leishmanolysin family protein [Tetrahymena thermophila SB210]EAR86150.2 leishmanolysin family protein [Tetrahymena thermophila SB210]|eukprot:XP_976745.2 leishmanolysin family protein [Tetrahymena thermophila SB210]
MIPLNAINEKKHVCNHDNEISYNNIPSDYFETFENKFGKRFLQFSEDAQPLRLTYDITQLSNSANGTGMTDAKRNYIVKILKAAQVFFKNLIQIQPRSTPIKSQGLRFCGQAPFIMYYPPELLKNGQGIYNSDMHLLVTYFNDNTSSQLASAGFCELDPNPIIARVRFNIGTMSMSEDNTTFQENVSVALHELTHALGFSGGAVQYWIDPETGRPYGSSTVSKVLQYTNLWGFSRVSKISSQNVLQVARNYFACSTIDGMFLENQGGSGSMGSHWEKDLIRNEYMTASQVQGSVISEFTAALLRDTGFYASINSNLLSPIYWGKYKGCDFFYNVCNSTTTSYPEFQPSNSINQQKCDFYNMAIGIVSSTIDIFSQCPITQPYQNEFCQDPQFKPNEQNRMNTGVNSYCFQSTALKNGYTSNSQYKNQRCNKINCNSDFSIITVYLWQQESFNCTSPGQVIDLSKVSTTTYGVFTCPQDFQMICSQPKTCPNQCSSNGVCINGYCICINGYAGQDCSIKCDSPNVYDGTRCISQCPNNTFKNPDNTCKPSCPKGYYQDYSLQSCLLCHSNCSTCTGSSPSQCSSCNLGFELDGTTCIEHICHESCGTCYGSQYDQCTSCQSGYTQKGSTCISNCHSSCKTCSVFYDANSCTSCDDGFYFNNNQCIQCPSQCATCETQNQNGTLIVQCIFCNYGYTMINDICLQCTYPCADCYDNQTSCTECARSHILNVNVCEPTCDESCQTCSKFVDPNSCTSCYPGQYLETSSQVDQGTCIQCQSNCSTCRNGQSCDSCISGYLLQSDGICTPICDESCLTCSSPNDRNSCLSCRAPFVLQNKQCLQCGNGFYYDNGSCVSCSQNCQSCQNKLKCNVCLEGYNLDKYFNCVPLNSCHQTCKNCVGDSYFQCTSCPQNRQLIKLDASLSFGICQCPENTTDYNDSDCPQSNTQKYILQTVIGSFSGSALTSLLTSIGFQNPLIILSYFTLSQGISYFNLLNAKQSVGFDEALGIIQFSNFEFQSLKSIDEVSNSTRNLSEQNPAFQQSNITSITYNPKIILNHKSNKFLQNSQVILWIQEQNLIINQQNEQVLFGQLAFLLI